MGALKIVQLEIEGFRRFRARFVLDVRSPDRPAPMPGAPPQPGDPLDYLVLAGPNGCGKTTILEAMLLALGREDLIVRDGDAKARAASARGRLETGAVLRVDLWNGTRSEKWQVERTAPGVSLRITGGEGQAEGPPAAQYLGEEAQTRLSALAVEYISARRLPALIGAVQDETRGRPPANTEANRLWVFKDRLRKQQGRRVPGYKGPEPRDVEWLDKLNAYWKAFRDDDTAFAMTVVDPEDLDRTEWDLFLYRGETRICPIDALSSGEQEILAMAVPFITEAFDGLLLIDEPEQHLHPQWQARVLRALRTLVPTSQVIVATHADDPWDDAMSWERRLLVEPDDPRARRGASVGP